MATCGVPHQQLCPAYIGGRVGVRVGGIQQSIQTPFDDEEIISSGVHHVHVAINMAITTRQDGERKGNTNRYTQHLILGKLLLVILILMLNQHC